MGSEELDSAHGLKRLRATEPRGGPDLRGWEVSGRSAWAAGPSPSLPPCLPDFLPSAHQTITVRFLCFRTCAEWLWDYSWLRPG